MKKLHIINLATGTCPRCSHKLHFNSKHYKAIGLRIAAWIVLFFFATYLIGGLGNAILYGISGNSTPLICLLADIVLGGVLIILCLKIKNFEIVPHETAHCDKCHDKWIVVD